MRWTDVIVRRRDLISVGGRGEECVTKLARTESRLHSEVSVTDVGGLTVKSKLDLRGEYRRWVQQAKSGRSRAKAMKLAIGGQFEVKTESVVTVPDP